MIRAAQENQSDLYMLPPLAPASAGKTNAVLQKYNSVPSLIETQSAYKQERHTEILALVGIQAKVKEARLIFPGVPSALVIVCGYSLLISVSICIAFESLGF